MKTFSLSLVASSEELLRFEAKSASVPGSAGQLGVMADHFPLLAQLGLGLIHVIDQNEQSHWFGVTGGFFEMMGDHATVLADEIITPPEAVERAYLKGKPLYFPQEYTSQTQKSDITRALLWRKLFARE